MQHKLRLAGAECAREKSSVWIASVNQRKLSFDQPAGPWRFAVFENSGGRDFFQLLLQIVRKLDRRKRFANRHFAVT